MSENQAIQKLGIQHDALLHFMLSNPTMAKSQVAARFGVSPGWLSQVINSQAFMEARARLTDTAYHETVLPIREKLQVLADQAVDRMLELLPKTFELDDVRKTAATVLEACGYTAPKGSQAGPTLNQQNNFYIGNASPEVVKRAQERIGLLAVVPVEEEDSDRV